MNKYDIEVVVIHRFTVTATDPHEAYKEAQDYDEHWADTSVERIVIKENNPTPTTN